MASAVAQITEREAFDAALAAPEFLLLKHSTSCPISGRAFRACQAFLAGRGVAAGWIHVVDQRDWSREVAERTGVAHQSPQVLLLRNGSVAWSASHFDITEERLAAALAG